MATSSAIQGADLVAFVHDGSDAQTVSVIIEAKRPSVRAAASGAVRRTTTSPRRVLPPSAAVLEKRRFAKQGVIPDLAAMGSVEKTLKRLGLDGMARRNNLSGSFVVEATSKQIQELAATPGVQAIRPNRKHRRVAP